MFPPRTFEGFVEELEELAAELGIRLSLDLPAIRAHYDAGKSPTDVLEELTRAYG